MGEGLDLGSIGGVAAGAGGGGGGVGSLGLGDVGGIVPSVVDPTGLTSGNLPQLLQGNGGFGLGGFSGGAGDGATPVQPQAFGQADAGDLGNQLTGDQSAGGGGGVSSQDQQPPPPQSPMDQQMPAWMQFLPQGGGGAADPSVNPFQTGAGAGGGGASFGTPGGANAGDFLDYPGLGGGGLPNNPTTFGTQALNVAQTLPQPSQGFPDDFGGRFAGQSQGYPGAGQGVAQDTAFEQQQEAAMAPDGGDGGGAADGGAAPAPQEQPPAAPPAPTRYGGGDQPPQGGAGGRGGGGGMGGQGRPGDALESFLRGIFGGGGKGGAGGLAGLLKPLLSRVLQSAFRLSPSLSDMAAQAITQGLLPGAGRGADGTGTGGGPAAVGAPDATPGGDGGGPGDAPPPADAPPPPATRSLASLAPGPRRFPGTGIRADTANTLAAGGMSDNATAGIMRNIQQESGFRAGSREPDQPRFGGEAHFAHGLYQEGGENWNRFASWLQSKGLDVNKSWRDPQLQTQFVVDNMKRNYPRLWQAMNNASSPAEAADLFLRGYLRPAPRHLAARSAGFRRGVPSVLQQLGIQ